MTHKCAWCGEVLNIRDFIRLQDCDTRLVRWAERFCSLRCVALWIAEEPV